MDEYSYVFSDFVYSNNSGFFFTQESVVNFFSSYFLCVWGWGLSVLTSIRSLIRTGAAFPFTAHASSPTVTMPRIKAITTGSVPSFSDVVLNIAESESMSTLIHQDTIITQLKSGLSGKLVMYGDDTWLNLFPGTFDRYDGTSSFFVSVSELYHPHSAMNGVANQTDHHFRTLQRWIIMLRGIFLLSLWMMTGP